MAEDSLTATQQMQIGFQLMETALGNSVAAAVSGSSSFGQAMEKMAKDTLAALAEEATVQALDALGWAFYYLGHGDYVGATDMFTSAAEFGAVAGAAAAVGTAIPSGTASTAAATSSTAATASPAQTAAPQPVQTINLNFCCIAAMKSTGLSWHLENE